jgi:hypothetical protein
MTQSKLGLHWLRYHSDNQDFAHIEAMQYRSVKPFEWMWNNPGFCADLLAALPASSYILARDHPKSEEKDAMWADPEGTGNRHADDWADKVQRSIYTLPTDRTFFLGINEPDATAGDRSAIDRYTVAFLDRLAQHGLRGGAFNFSTGHPRTVDGTANTPPDYTVFEASHQAIVRGNHIPVCHIYGTAAQPCVPGHYDRLAACPWRDVEWVIGEYGIDEHVVGGGAHHGYIVPFKDNPAQYCPWLDEGIMGVESTGAHIHSYQIFTYDFSKPWGTFDVRVVRRDLEVYPWLHTSSTPPDSIPPQPEPTPPASKVVWPLPAALAVTGRFGERYAGQLYPHQGLDIAAPHGSDILAIADGQVAWNAWDDKYGNYLRIYHPHLRLHSFYAHMAEPSPLAQYATVKAGQLVGHVGSTGNSTGAHLHLECRTGDDTGYKDLTHGYGNGRCCPEAALWLLGVRVPVTLDKGDG